MLLPYETRGRLESLGTPCGFFRNVALMVVLEARSQVENEDLSMGWVGDLSDMDEPRNEAKSEPTPVNPKSEVRRAPRDR